MQITLPLPELEAHNLTPDDKYTPEKYFGAISKVLGGQIGLDPTADPGKRVPARYHITAQQDCLLTDWQQYLETLSTVFMNPPYSNTEPFLRRMCEYLPQIKAVTLTLSGILQNKGCRPLLNEAKPVIVFPNGRINFLHGGKSNDRDVVWLLWGIDDSAAQQFAIAVDGMFAKVM